MTTLAGGQGGPLPCDEQAEWYPDLADMESKITDRTKAVVIINPSNPTGAVYPKEIVEGILDLARRHGFDRSSPTRSTTRSCTTTPCTTRPPRSPPTWWS